MADRTLILDGHRVAYRASGGNGPAVLLVHGNSSSVRTWHHLLISQFGDRYRCLALDALLGAPPVAPADGPQAFRPDPALRLAFTGKLSEQDVRDCAESLLVPSCPVPLEPIIGDILATDPNMRVGISEALQSEAFVDVRHLAQEIGQGWSA